MKKSLFIGFICFFGNIMFAFSGNCLNSEFFEGKFIHPGMAQSSQDLDYMRDMINKGEEPWKTAFENLKKQTSLDFKPEPFADVSEGGYGANSIGGREFSKNAAESYNHALMWYITKDKTYADKAIEILNAWSSVLRSFDGNNAKLKIGLSGYYFLNTAEILKYTTSGWKKEDMNQFTRMVLTVFYPGIKDFFSEANGNWDASMISTMMCIGVFTDNVEIFNRAVERFYRGEANSGITRYLYPTGQCQETTRDWGHVQLGLGELSKAAQIAETQGLDFYSVADDRLARGMEYTARFLCDNQIELFGVFSDRSHGARDIYESIYRYYKNKKHILLPYSEKIIKKYTRKTSSTNLLSATKISNYGEKVKLTRFTIKNNCLKPTEVGALKNETKKLDNYVVVKPGESIQNTIDKYKNTGKWIILEEGVHVFESPLKLYNGTYLAGRGNQTILFPAPKLKTAIVNGENVLSDVCIRDLLIEGASKVKESTDPNQDRRQRLYMSAPERAGIVLRSVTPGGISNLKLDNITIQNFTKSGLLIYSGKNIQVTRCDISNNGGNVVPGAGYHHNINLAYVTDSKVSYTRLDDSMYGNGINITFSKNISVTNSEMARNGSSGIYCAQSNSIKITENLTEGNDRYGIYVEKLMDACSGFEILENIAQNNKYCGINAFSAILSIIENNKSIHNGEN